MAGLPLSVARRILVVVLGCLVIGDTGAPSRSAREPRFGAMLQALGPDIPFGPPAIPGVDGPVMQPLEDQPAQSWALPPLQTRTVRELMEEQAAEDAVAPPVREPVYLHEFEFEERRNLLQDPNAPAVSQWPPAPSAPLPSPSIPFVLSNIEGPDSTQSGFVPPDSMGDAGPTQYIVAVNGRIRSYNKATLAADGVLDLSSNTFFNTVRNSNNVVDPRIRFDRQTNRWFVVYITVAVPNRFVIAFSDTATITASTTWSYTFFADTVVNGAFQSCLGDYETLGIDTHALYMGANEFCGTSVGTVTYFASAERIIPKATLIAGAGTSAGFVQTTSFTPQGVDNYDVAPALGYFVGVDSAVFGALRLSQITNPASTSPTRTSRQITVAATSFPRRVPNTGGPRSFDGIDDRLMNAVVRNGALWAAHAICVNTLGVAIANTDPTCRNGVRWYELTNLTSATPSVNQLGTVFDSADSNPRHYWVPSVNINTQGVAVFGFASAAANTFAGAAYAHREAADLLGTTRPAVQHLAGLATYIAGDTGIVLRWGDYSMVSVDPSDDVTFWTIQEYVKDALTWGTKVTKLATPGSAAAPTIGDIPDQATNEDTPLGPIGFTIGDPDTPVASLTLSGASSNTGLVPVSNIVFGGAGASRNVSVTPAPNATGTATITVTVSDGSLTASDSFVLTVSAVNDAPVIADVANQATNEDVPLGPVPFTIGDVETAAASLTVTASSSNTTLVPLSGLTLGGSGASRNVTIAPAADQSGSATITLTVSDGTATASDTFLVTVNAVNDPPTIAPIADKSVSQGGTVPAFALTLADIDSPPASIVVTAIAADTTLLPPSGIVVGGTGFNRTLALTPAAALTGATTVTVTVSDGAATASIPFTLTVLPRSGPPSAPLNFVATLAGSTLGMTWDLPASGELPTDYILQAAIDSGFTTLVYDASTGSAARTLSIPGVPGGVFYLRVRARNSLGTGPASNVQKIGEPPNPPTDFQATLTGSTLSMTWLAPASGTTPADYLFEAALNASFSPVVYTQPTVGAVTSLVVPGVPPGTTIYMRVRARNGSGVSAPSNVQVVGPGGCTAAPGQATGFSITKLGGLNVRLAWTAPAGGNAATDYVVQAALDAGFTAIVFNSPLGSSATTFNAIAPPGSFFVRIVATNACGSATPSNVVNLIMP